MKTAIRTDLALESAELIGDINNIDGCDVEIKVHGGVEHIVVDIKSDSASKRLGKPVGRYVTLQSMAIRTGDDSEYGIIFDIMQNYITDVVRSKKKIFIAGLGNRNITPDSLGPAVVDKISVLSDDNNRQIYALAPGVLGTTGIETERIIKAVVTEVNPEIIIAIDALAARNIERVTTTIQLADTGIIPGSGVGNSRSALTEETLGVPVVAIGVPTVVDASTLANNSMDMLAEAAKSAVGEDSQLYKTVKSIESENRSMLISHVLSPYVGNLIVTPTEIDSVIDHVSMIIAKSINSALVCNI